ncbi:glycosyltransferase family 2 protein [Pseudonocardia sp. H11422]|uniref:glycosyltransferase family 2 protein n=1 Tax=Pseudonocardia sp. H11422 TaxID=2835866 RepID=UPI001BDD3A1F|nr:glycosyltransferase family 2 protein [Pseudonocardia sp. H11422]
MTGPLSAPDSPPAVSVVICAYTEERWDDVVAAVESVTAQRLEPHEIILVIDHNPALYSRLKRTLPDVLVVQNRSERGLSGGKNTAIQMAKGDVLAFLDDDAVAEPDWLTYLVAGYGQPEVIGVGGLTLPLWETARPAWFPEEFDWTVGCTFTGREPGRVRNLLGGNASFRREAFHIAGGFPTGIGRSAANRRPLGCEETEFCIRLARRRPDSIFLFDARAVIHHRVPRTRSRFRYFRSRCYAEGLSKAQVTRSVGVADGLATERRYATTTLRRGVAQGLLDALLGDPAGLSRSAAITAGLVSTTVGYVVGTLQGSLRAPRRGARR